MEARYGAIYGLRAYYYDELLLAYTEIFLVTVYFLCVNCLVGRQDCASQHLSCCCRREHLRIPCCCSIEVVS